MNTPSQLRGPSPHSSPNFKATTLLQNLFSSIPKRQSHLPSKALLKVVTFLIPKPPLSIGIHTLSQPNKCVLESPYKKSLCSFTILFATWRLDSVLLSNVSLPPFDKYNFFHPTNFLSIFSNIGFQIERDLWDAPNGIPR
ncbi:hypothetical protein ACB092_02G080200 [Castanea dentata]